MSYAINYTILAAALCANLLLTYRLWRRLADLEEEVRFPHRKAGIRRDWE